ncbi:MAG TPA: sulfatase-like hydrolase/transferase [Gammaproteobacteria bacterium]|jgi:hypothetical protein|nr:sulfatase-like hydrolase/transferase [Gammaproteobacteria bacterium]
MYNYQKSNLFFYLLSLTGFFLLLEISFFIQCNKSYFYVFNFVSANLELPITLLPGILYFIVAQLSVHIGYCLLIWSVTLAMAYLCQCYRIPCKTYILGMGLWSLGMITVLMANLIYFPNSKFSLLFEVLFFHPYVTNMVWWLLLASCLFCLGLTLLCAIVFFVQSKYRMLIFLSFLSLCSLGFLFSRTLAPIASPTTAQQPNIIIIGVDSVRPDFLSFFGHKNPTPFLDQFLSQATIFKEAVTPLARTFPSWSSVLTGQHPKQMNVRSNLARQSKTQFNDSLAILLQQQGYETIYATDETRFSNIGKNFGFDRMVTPPVGLNDFLLGTFNDFPLSNLLINTLIGKWLFPYSYANRPVYFTYDPNSFLQLISPMLSEQRTKPLFLAIHFCLPHHPFVWAALSADKVPHVLTRYEQSIVRVDQQLRDFFALLTQYHLLDHAIVVLLSDHGEALALEGDRITDTKFFMSDRQQEIPRFYPPTMDDEPVNQSAGHGTDVLGLPQYRTLLAFKLYGLEPQQVSIVSGGVSLIDVKPTILSLIGVNNQYEQAAGSAISLADSILKTSAFKPLPTRHIFIESDFSPTAIRTVYPETQQIVLEGIRLFEVDPKTTRLIVKDEMNTMIINSKQYANLYGDWILALYPQSKAVYAPILVNQVTGEWTNDLSSAFARGSPAIVMLAALKDFYGEELQGRRVDTVPR